MAQPPLVIARDRPVQSQGLVLIPHQAASPLDRVPLQAMARRHPQDPLLERLRILITAVASRLCTPVLREQ